MSSLRGIALFQACCLVCVLSACGDESGDGDTMAVTVTAASTMTAGSGGDGGDDGMDDGGQTSTTGSADDGDGGMDDAPPATTAPADDGAVDSSGDGMADDGMAGSSGGDGGTTGMAGGICDPDPADDACNMCTKSNCCDQLMACTADADCSCWIDCVDAGGDPLFGCPGECNNVNIFGAGPTGDLVSCSMSMCGGQCQ